MTLNIKPVSKRVINEPVPNTQVSSRTDIYEQDTVDEDAIKEDSQKMDALMRQLMGGDDEDEEEEEEPEDMEDVQEDNNEEEEFSFRLFASQPVATVNIADGKDNTDSWAKAVADQQVYEFDETDPEFVVRAKEAVIDFDTIVKQSTVPYPALRFPRRIIHILSPEEQAKKDASEKKKTMKKRKSKKCRDFEKAVKEGKIELKPNTRNPKTPDGWPGWPGNLTRVAIINYDGGKKGGGSNGARGGFRGRGVSRGNSRGGSGGMMPRGRGRGRGRAF